MKNLPKVPTWRLERESNPRPFGRKETNLLISHNAPQHIMFLLFLKLPRSGPEHRGPVVERQTTPARRPYSSNQNQINVDGPSLAILQSRRVVHGFVTLRLFAHRRP